MRKRILTLLTALCLCAALLPAAKGEEEAGRSGSADVAKMTQEEIRRLLQDSPGVFSGGAMAQPASTAAPYATGQVSASALAAANQRFSALRRLAGLPEVALDADLCDQAQYGAVLLAATGKLTHHPAQPDGMDDDFYQKGRAATSSSNIYMGTGASLPQAVDAFFDDSDVNNLANVGHRRWMLNPSMAKTGYGFSPSGFAYAGQNYNFVCQWAFDRSGGCDYDFISWPASGNFPSDLFDKQTAWSVTLNPERYAQPKLEDITVILTRSDGVSWRFSGDEEYAVTESENYLNVNTTNYGVDNCIIFRPKLDVSGYEGSYTVEITGIKSKEGENAPLRYQVDFFSLESPAVESRVENVELSRRTLEMTVGETARLSVAVTPADAVDGDVVWASADPEILSVENGLVTALSPGSSAVLVTAGLTEITDVCFVKVVERSSDAPTSFADVPEDSWFGSAVLFSTGRGLFVGVGQELFDPEGSMSRAMVMTVLARLDGVDTEPRSGETWDIRGRRWAVTNHISDGLNEDAAVSLEELATMLFRYARSKGLAETTMVDNLSGMPDGRDVSDWAVDGMNWAVTNGVLQGDQARRLNPQRSATRAQVAVILQRYLTEIDL